MGEILPQNGNRLRNSSASRWRCLFFFNLMSLILYIFNYKYLKFCQNFCISTFFFIVLFWYQTMVLAIRKSNFRPFTLKTHLLIIHYLKIFCTQIHRIWGGKPIQTLHGSRHKIPYSPNSKLPPLNSPLIGEGWGGAYLRTNQCHYYQRSNPNRGVRAKYLTTRLFLYSRSSTYF